MMEAVSLVAREGRDRGICLPFMKKVCCQGTLASFQLEILTQCLRFAQNVAIKHGDWAAWILLITTVKSKPNRNLGHDYVSDMGSQQAGKTPAGYPASENKLSGG